MVRIFVVLLFSIVGVMSFASVRPTALIMKCKGRNHQIMTGFIRSVGQSKILFRGKKFEITRVDPSLKGSGFVVVGRSGKDFLKFIGKSESKIQTHMYTGVHSSDKNKDFVKENIPLICHLKAT